MATSKRVLAPTYYEATEDIFINHPDGATMPACAARAGDRVTADVVEANGWQDKVRVPASFTESLPDAGKEGSN